MVPDMTWMSCVHPTMTNHVVDCVSALITLMRSRNTNEDGRRGRGRGGGGDDEEEDFVSVQ